MLRELTVEEVGYVAGGETGDGSPNVGLMDNTPNVALDASAQARAEFNAGANPLGINLSPGLLGALSNLGSSLRDIVYGLVQSGLSFNDAAAAAANSGGGGHESTVGGP